MKWNEYLNNWNSICWILAVIGIPIGIPWIVYRVMNIVKFKQKKANLRDKIVVITGASSGLGEAMAHVFYNCGCQLILVSRRKQELQRVKNALTKIKIDIPTHTPVIFPLDLTEIHSIPSEVDKLLKVHGNIDILINNAGVSYRGEVMDTKVDVDMKVMLINYFGQVALTKAILPSMVRKKSGHIVFTSSIQGKIAIPFRSAYTASKHALEAWCDSARAELHSSKIKITVVSPGYIRTSLSINALTGTGQQYGVMDETTKTGYSPNYVADKVLKAILKGNSEVTVANFTQKLAIMIRVLFPNSYFKIMERRAKKLRKSS